MGKAPDPAVERALGWYARLLNTSAPKAGLSLQQRITHWLDSGLKARQIDAYYEGARRLRQEWTPYRRTHAGSAARR